MKVSIQISRVILVPGRVIPSSLLSYISVAFDGFLDVGLEKRNNDISQRTHLGYRRQRSVACFL